MIKFSTQDHYQAYLSQVDLLKASGMNRSGLVEMDATKADLSMTDEQDTLKKYSTYRKPKEPKINLMAFSEADSIVLQVVPGIGQVLAGRIIKYRESLGGFHQEQQLLEVYGVTEEVAKKVFEYFSFTPAIHKKLKVNEWEAGELAEHPYINYGPAKVIVAYRKQHGNYNSAEDLLKIKIFNEDWLDRVRPYLVF
ncbi:MAG: helix-hairpin-helix domain-containing protein [Anditalea sp.]